jgi:Protein of unknown function (DUF551)
MSEQEDKDRMTTDGLLDMLSSDCEWAVEILRERIAELEAVNDMQAGQVRVRDKFIEQLEAEAQTKDDAISALREQVRYWYRADKLPLPDEGSYLVIVERPKDFDFYAVAQQTEDGGMEDMDGQDLGYEASDISHWMPLPPPPQEQG